VDSLIKKLLVYVDGSEESVTAAQYAICLAKISNAEITALYVVNTRAAEDLVKANIFLKSEEEEYTRDIEADAERYLNHVRNLGLQKGITIVTKKKRGTPFLEIKNEVVQEKPDLLILGELSKIRSRRDEFYNEAERAMRNVGCSVLIVKDEETVWAHFENLTP